MNYLFALIAVAALASARGRTNRPPTVVIEGKKYVIVGVDDEINGPTTTLKEVL